ncbi:putative reverse transcriptase domain-containing protein [Tanacetum coccineum]
MLVHSAATKCNKIGHFARDCRNAGNTNVANTQKGNGAAPKGNGCFECRAPGHFKRDCPKLKNKFGGKWEGTKVVLCSWDAGKEVEMHRGTCCHIVTAPLTPLENCYEVELDDGKLVGIRHYYSRVSTLNFLDTSFIIDSIARELVVRCHYRNETLTFCGNESSNGREYRLTVISCSKAQEYMAKGCQVFLAQISAKKKEDKSKGKQIKDVPIVRDFPVVFPEDFPGHPPARPVEF